jgi:CheY-like chemotaxis protein
MRRDYTNTKIKSRRVLLVDDDDEFSRDLSFMLDGSYLIVSASESKRTIELMEKEKFDLVILDMKIPAFYANVVKWRRLKH